MSHTATYPAADRKKLETFEWRGRVSEIGARRAIKMLKPMCHTCQAGTFPWAPEWWKSCDHTPAPYFRFAPKVIRKDVIVEDENGFYIDEEATNKSKITRLVKVPNVTEVIVHLQQNAGQGVAIFMKEKGFITFPEGGLAPMCEAYGCGTAWPTFVSEEYGRYCSERHARYCAMKQDQMLTMLNPAAGADQEIARIDKRRWERDIQL